MQVKVKYSDYLTSKGNKKSESYELQVDENITIKFELVRPNLDVDIVEDEIVEGQVDGVVIQPSPSCKVTISNSSTLDTVECNIPQKEYRDFMQVVKEISTQFNM